MSKQLLKDETEYQKQIRTANKLLQRLRLVDNSTCVSCAIREDIESPVFYLSTRIDIQADLIRRGFPCHAESPLAVMLKVLETLKEAHAQGYDLIMDGRTVHLFPIINDL